MSGRTLLVSNAFDVLAEVNGDLTPSSTVEKNSSPARSSVRKLSKSKKQWFVLVGHNNARHCRERLRHMGAKGSYSSQLSYCLEYSWPLSSRPPRMNSCTWSKRTCVIVGGTNNVTNQSIAKVEKYLEK